MQVGGRSLLYSIVHDITERREAEKEIVLQKARFEQLFENTPIGIALLDEQDVIRSVNPAFEDIFLYTSAEVTNQSLNSVIVPPHLVEEATRLSARAREGKPVQNESQRRRKDGTLVPVQIYAVPIKIDQKLIGIFAIYIDLSAQKQREQKLEYLSTHDTMTGLYNRAYFETELLRLDRGRNYPVSVVVADVDGLKQINDNLGHAAGDELLRRAAHVLKSAFRADDIVARIGGDEFGVLLPETDAETIAQAIRRVRQILQKHNEESHAYLLSFSVGFATSRPGFSLIQALGEADSAMYREKSNRHTRE
jgi:diguanylate cyclase (GGDEF)-like protein/PAS domain S-box-containing protein